MKTHRPGPTDSPLPAPAPSDSSPPPSGSLPTLLLRPGEADRVIAGHPWIYHSSVLRVTREPHNGDLVQVKDHRQRFLGVGFYHGQSKIRVRLLANERVEVNEAFFADRITAALAVRKRHLPDANCFRVVSSESDFLSGLIVDRYGDALVVQMSSLGMDLRQSLILNALNRVLAPKIIVERNDMSSRKLERLDLRKGILANTESVDHANLSAYPVRMNGLTFTVDLLEGHKTGMYLDQQVNYRLVGAMARGAAVLDCFSFQGGFALHAAQGGALHVTGIDQSESAVRAAAANADANQLGDRCEFVPANVFDWLKEQTAAPRHEKVAPRYDLIILDPPSFTRNRASVPDALRGYKEIHLRAMKLIKPGGTLATFCCSHHVDSTTFQEVILAAAFDARRILRRVSTFTQAPDHPILPGIPETEYLKGFAFEMA